MLMALSTFLHAVAVVLEPARVHQEAGLRRAPQLGGLADRLLGDAGHFGRALRRPFAARAAATASNPTVWFSMNA